jgi:hypothetical protein
VTFELDISGSITILPGQSVSGMASARYWHWSDLTPFCQGYVEAMFSGPALPRVGLLWEWVGFSDLAPETLARIIEDCEALRPSPVTVEHGRTVWKQRQEGKAGPDFPPLAVSLGDNDKVYTR